jgi:hypothetical protein
MACSPQKRLHRLVALHPELTQRDTIRIQDTTILPQVQIDTLVHFQELRDTIQIEKENVKIQIHQVHDTIFIQAQKATDTVVVHKEIPVEKIVYQKPDGKTKNVVIWFLLRVLVMMLVVLIIGIKK